MKLFALLKLNPVDKAVYFDPFNQLHWNYLTKGN